MGTNVTLTVYSKEDQRKIAGAFDLLYRIENKISANREGTVIAAINEKAGVEAVKVDEDVFNLICFALELYRKTDGYFNPAIGALTKLWNIGSENPQVPSREDLEVVLPLLNPDDIVLDMENKTVFLTKEGMRLDLGGIGKGYAADALKSYFKENGVKKAIINLGGNILILGEKKEGEKWNVGIVDPENTQDYFTTVSLEEGTVVTSGSYERFFEEDGVIYHHILNPETGYPWETDLLSATIVTDSSTLADGLSTAVFAGGIDEAERLASEFNVKIILLMKDRVIVEFDKPESKKESTLSEKFLDLFN